MTDDHQAEANDVAVGVEPAENGEARVEDQSAENGEEREAKRKRNRAKLALRIPDDEIARPSSVIPPPVVAEAAPFELPMSDLDAKPIVPMRIVDLASQPPPRSDDVATSAGGPTAPTVAFTQDPPLVIPPAPNSAQRIDESWTPFQPTAVDAAEAADPKARQPSTDDVSIDVSMDDDMPSPQAVAPDAQPTLPFLPSSPTEISQDDMVPEELPTERVMMKATPSSGPPPAMGVAVAIPAPPRAPSFEVPPTTKIQEGAAGIVTSATLESKPSRPPAAALVDDAEASNIPEVEPDLSEPPSSRGGGSDEELAAEDVVSVEPADKPMARPSSSPPPAKTDTISKPAPPPAPPASGKAPLVIVPPGIVQATGPSGLAPPQALGDPQKRKGRLWWEELFGDDFIRTMAKITDEQIAAEVDFIEDSLGVAKGGTMLDLACGTGRHAIELARRTYQVVGFDLSLAMLARAAEEAQERDQKINFVQGDMREITFENTFDGVYCWNTSFGFFEEEKNALVCGKVHKSLRAGGQFLLDVINRDFIMQQSPSLVWFEGDGCICMDEMSMDWITSRMKVKRTMMLDDGRTREIEYSIRVYSLHELGKLLHDQGFRVAEVSGRTATPGVFFGAASPRVLILAEKK